MLQFLKKEWVWLLSILVSAVSAFCTGSIYSALFGFAAGFGFAIVVIALKKYNDNR